MDNGNVSDDDDDDRVDIYISRVSTLQGELQRLKAHRTSKLLYLHLDPQSVPELYSAAELGAFVRDVVRALPEMTELQISKDDRNLDFEGHPTVVFPVELARVLCDAVHTCQTKLTSLRFYRVQLHGSLNGFQDLAEALRKVTSLEKMFLDKVSIFRETENNLPGTTTSNEEGCALDPVVRALAGLFRLRHLRILGTCDFGRAIEDDERMVVLRNSTLQALCQSSSLESLCLIHFNLCDENVTHMAQQLETNQNLKELDIDCTLGLSSSKALAKMLEKNGVLASLNLCVRDPGENEDGVEDGIPPTEEALLEEDKINQCLAEGVGNSALTTFSLFRRRISSKSQASFREMMPEQYSLESLTLYTGDEAINKALAEDIHIKFYCKVNYYGRRKLLLEQPPHGRLCGTSQARTCRMSKQLLAPRSFTPERALVDTLGRVTNDLNCLYYFLSIKPSLCDRALQRLAKAEHQVNQKRNALSALGTFLSPSKRTRLYRGAKYRGVTYR